MRSNGLLDGRRAYVTVGLRFIHVGKMACVIEWTHADLGADHVFTSCSCTSGKKGTDVLESNFRVDLKYQESSLLLTGSSGGLQVSSNSLTALGITRMSSSWRCEGHGLSI